MLKKLTTCPLGHQCEKIVGDEVHVCAWLMTVKGIEPSSGEQVNKQECAIVVQALVIMDNTKATYGQNNAIATLTGVMLNEKATNPSQKLIA